MPDLIAPSLEPLLDDLFTRRAKSIGAVAVGTPLMLGQPFVDALDLTASSPYAPVRVTEASLYLPPATCHRLFQALMDARLEEEAVFTLTGPCFRQERSLSATRQFAFTMNETVFIGSADATSRRRESLMEAEMSLAGHLGLEVDLQPATDPFTGNGPDRGRRLLQKMLQLKFELVATMGDGEVAVSSFNLHGDHFTAPLGIGAGPGPTSGCVARGIARWALALTERWGSRLEEWPVSVRRLLVDAEIS